MASLCRGRPSTFVAWIWIPPTYRLRDLASASWSSARDLPQRGMRVEARQKPTCCNPKLVVVDFRNSSSNPCSSPAAPARYLGIEYPSEDDVLHCDSLPTFNNTLSREEAEQLMSYLTVDYVRVPLVLGFFASRDRVTYLFNPGLQALLRAVLFEGDPWILKGGIERRHVRL